LVDRLLEEQMARRRVDLAVVIPTPIQAPRLIQSSEPPTRQPKVYIFHNSAQDKSKIAATRFSEIISAWQKNFVTEVLHQNNVPQTLIRGIAIASSDVADKAGVSAAMWSKLLPFIVMMWSLTGAFYPAIDLCAGEKERGTFETLLSSPAKRSEIAIGKLMTVISFSMATALLNLLSMAFTGLFVYSRMAGNIGSMEGLTIGPPPLTALLWLVVALIPISGLFSAVALAAAAFARSSKEGQYYLVPLMMISMPLMMIPMLPAAKLDLGTSLIPVSGLMLLLRGLIEGQYEQAFQFFAPVCGVTLLCCWLSVRWVIYQFNSETVLFRASERFGVGAWVKQIARQRSDLPGVGSALLCCVMILVLSFFVSFSLGGVPSTFLSFSKTTVIQLLTTVLVPALFMAVVLSKNPRKALRLNSCSVPVACAAIIMAICFHPLFMAFRELVMIVYPMASDMSGFESVFENILADSPGIWAIVLVMAIIPAVFEEIAFRGFILSGLEGLKNKWQAIALTSLFFGLSHSIIQQSVITGVVGVVLGIVAMQSRSVLPCILYHVTHNALTLLLSMAQPHRIETSPILSRVLHSPQGEGYEYTLGATFVMGAIAIGLLVWFLKFVSAESNSLPSAKTKDDAIFTLDPNAESAT
jgi:sodium transport system permease protein